MNKNWHRGLTAALSGLTGLSGVLAAADTGTLGVTDQAWAWTTVVLAAAIAVLQGVRQATDVEP